MSCDVMLCYVTAEIEHMYAHTRILCRAVQWEESRFDKALLLKGNDAQVGLPSCCLMILSEPSNELVRCCRTPFNGCTDVRWVLRHLRRLSLCR